MTKKHYHTKGESAAVVVCALSSLHQVPATKRSILSRAIKVVRNIKVLTKTALVVDPATLLSRTSHHQQTVTARVTFIRKPYYSSLLSSLGTPGVAIVSHIYAHSSARCKTLDGTGTGRTAQCCDNSTSRGRLCTQC